MKRAVIYIRVSSKGQVDTDHDPEGLSLPGQREACFRKAEQLGADVVEEYVDAGETATSADSREQFRAMLDRVKTARDVDYVIVYKINRFARNRRDDANALFDIRSGGATLVSASENIDDTPVGTLVHGILATIAEYESANDSVEIKRCLLRKVEQGGTNGPAPLGYRNVVEDLPGRRVNSVALDPERAPLIQWAWEEFATGEWTIASMLDALTAKGLTTRPTPKKEPRPLSLSVLQRLLRNPYYYGVVRWKGAIYPGRHEPLIDRATFDKVQAILDGHRNGEKRRTHDHYLKSTLYCGHCGSRLCVMNARSKSGRYYLYFFCVGRHQGRTDCTKRYVQADELEDAVADEYRTIRLSDDQAEGLKQELKDELGRQRQDTETERRTQERRLARLERKRRKLLDAYYEDAIPADLFKEEQKKIGDEEAQAQRRLEATSLEFAAIEATLNKCLELVTSPHDTYRQAPDVVRRMFNQFFFEKVEVFDDKPLKAYFRPEIATIYGAAIHATPLNKASDEPADLEVHKAMKRRLRYCRTTNPDLSFRGRGLKEALLAEGGGFEPPVPRGHSGFRAGRNYLRIPGLTRGFVARR